MTGERDRLRAILAALQRHRSGRRSERLDPDQLALTLEEVEQSVAAVGAEAERKSAPRSAGCRCGAGPTAALCPRTCRVSRR